MGTCFQLECSSKENLVDILQTEWSEQEFEGISQLPQCSGTTSFDNQIQLYFNLLVITDLLSHKSVDDLHTYFSWFEIELKMARTVLDDTDQVDRNDEVARLAAIDLLIKSKGSYKSQVTMALNALQIKLNTLDSQKKAGLVHRDNLKDTEVNVANVESKKENWIKLLLRVAELSNNDTEKARYTEAAEKANSDTVKNIQTLFYLSYTDLHQNSY